MRLKPTLIHCLVVAAGLLCCSSVASAYYHWVYFSGDSAPFNPVPAKFDLTVPPDGHTINYFISDQGPGPLLPGDSFQALVSQIRLAADQWNGVASSNLKLAFGGFADAATQHSAPGIELVFDNNLTPGLLALTSITVPSNVSSVAGGASFVPILWSKMEFWKDL
ncbi:MAG: hypothetical protein ABSB35_28275, partial [Bryobacteraceae bacterium]